MEYMHKTIIAWKHQSLREATHPSFDDFIFYEILLPQPGSIFPSCDSHILDWMFCPCNNGSIHAVISLHLIWCFKICHCVSIPAFILLSKIIFFFSKEYLYLFCYASVLDLILLFLLWCFCSCFDDFYCAIQIAPPPSHSPATNLLESTNLMTGILQTSPYITGSKHSGV